MSCVSGETLHVTGKVFINSLHRTGTNWIACGIKMESTNDAGRTSSGVEFDDPSPTGSWLTVDFNRIAPVTGTDRLLLWVGGYDGTNVDVYFDNLVVTSTNTGAIVTNAVRTGYWQGDAAVNMTSQNVLSFLASGTYGVSNAQVWVKDGANATNAVYLTNFVDRLYSLPQRIDILWTNFPTVNRSQIKAVGFTAAVSNDLQMSRARSINIALMARSKAVSAPMVNSEGMPHFNPGQTVTNILVLDNVSGSSVTGVNVEVIQEYGEATYWLDQSPDVPAMLSPDTGKGDRLCGSFEQVFSNVTIGAASRLTVTNVYVMPLGHRVDHTQRQFEPMDWYFLRNYACRAQVDVVVRTPAGDTAYANEQTGCYSMDNDFDINNNGLPDAWEMQYSGSYTGMSANADSDTDGFNNLSEFIAGSDPTNPASTPKVGTVIYTNATPAAITFNSVTGRVYWVEWSPSITNPVWQSVGTNLVSGNGNVQSVMDSDSQTATSRYYRIGLKFGSQAWPL